MINQLFEIALWPVCISSLIFIVLWVVLAQNRYKYLPQALAEGFSGSRYVLTRGEQSGGVSDFFYDIDASITDPSSLKSVVDFYAEKINDINDKQKKADVLAFIEKDSGPVGALLLMSSIVERTKLPAIIVRLRKRLDLNAIKGNGQYTNQNVILISDVATSGGSLKNAITKIEALGANVIGAIVLVSRMEQNSIVTATQEIDVFSALKVKEKKDLEQEPLAKHVKHIMKLAG